MLFMAVAQFFSDDNAICYALPGLWTASCFHIMAQMQIQAIGELFIMTRQVAPGLSYRQLPCTANGK